ncbi:hypothetical protein APHAL10511_004245 [Amanita phalloides]|nr:hypothetical protein APHAL10511_004245 [Amanita phalloides]
MGQILELIETMMLRENRMTPAKITSTLEMVQAGDADVRMKSPPISPTHLSQRDLQGASHVTGGILWGHAQGNTFNFGNELANSSNLVSRTGKVQLYAGLHAQASDIKPQNISIPVAWTMKPVLEEVACKWPLITYGNPYISVLENQEWNTLGPYMTALELDEDVHWIKESGTYNLSLCYETEAMVLQPGFTNFMSNKGGEEIAQNTGSYYAESTLGSSVSGMLSGASTSLVQNVGDRSVTIPSFQSKLVTVLDVGKS